MYINLLSYFRPSHDLQLRKICCSATMLQDFRYIQLRSLKSQLLANVDWDYYLFFFLKFQMPHLPEIQITFRVTVCYDTNRNTNIKKRILLWISIIHMYLKLTFLKRLLSRKVAAFLRSMVTVFFLQALQAQSKHRRGPCIEVAVSRATSGWGTCSCSSVSFNSLLLSFDSFNSLSPLLSSASTEPDSRSAEASTDTMDDASSESTAYRNGCDLSTNNKFLLYLFSYLLCCLKS